MQNQITIPTLESISEILRPLQNSINELNSKIDSLKPPTKYYRNKDLKEIFGLSDNTIIEYRDNNIIPVTSIGNIYYYPVDKINEILKKNSNYFNSG
ncbi:MAG TPA: helix-turn-helix domain-containing protein [Puia sp.]|jgi:hypothetical protein|nr:helix-turn-helix domain-containing protein [Puia sp.]